MHSVERSVHIQSCIYRAGNSFSSVVAAAPCLMEVKQKCSSCVSHKYRYTQNRRLQRQKVVLLTGQIITFCRLCVNRQVQRVI